MSTLMSTSHSSYLIGNSRYHRALQLLTEEENSYLWFDARGLATILYQFSVHNISVEQYFIDNWESEACNQIQDFTPQGLTNSLSAFGRLELKPSATFIQAWEREACNDIKNFDPQGFTNSLYAFSRLGLKPSKEFIQSWEHEACTQIKTFKTQELVNSIYAFGRLDLKPSEKFITAWEYEACNKIQFFNAQALINSLYAFGRLELKSSEKFITAWECEAYNKIQFFNAQALTNSLYAFSQLGLKPSKDFIQSWEREACTKIKTFKAQELVNSIEAFKGLAIKPSIQFIEAWEREACDKIEDFNPKYLVFSVYAIYMINNLTNCHIKIPIPILRSIEEKYKMLDIRDCHQLWVANADFFQKSQQSLFSNEVLEYLRQYIENNGLSPSYMTKLQQEVSEILSQTSTKEIISEKWIPEIASYVDNFIADTNLIIQVDGPTHFNEYEQNSSTKFNTKLLENLGYKVQRISYFVWDQLCNEADKRKYIDRLLQDSYLENDILPLGSCTNNGSAVHDMVFLF